MFCRARRKAQAAEAGEFRQAEVRQNGRAGCRSEAGRRHGTRAFLVPHESGAVACHPDFTQELPRKLLPTRAKEGQSVALEKRMSKVLEIEEMLGSPLPNGDRDELECR